MRSLIGFPNPVNEKAARTVAGVVAVACAAVLLTGWYWLLVPIAYGFVARVLTGPKLSPLGALAQRVIAPASSAPRNSWRAPPSASRRGSGRWSP